METIADRLLVLIRNHPGRTERELAETLFGQNGYQQRVNQVLRSLIKEKRVRRQGRGGSGEPFRYVVN